MGKLRGFRRDRECSLVFLKYQDSFFQSIMAFVSWNHVCPSIRSWEIGASTASSIVGWPFRVSTASGNDSKQSVMVPVAPRILTGASIFFLPDGCNRAAASYQIKHPWAPESMSAETGTQFSSVSMIRSVLRGSIKSGLFIFQMGPCLQGIRGLWVTVKQRM